jgi:glycosyltransferase involved in cell wall biosynthesis
VSAIPVSVVVLTKNEEANLAKCLASVSEFSQIVVVDSQSEDRTLAIARAHAAEVVDFIWDRRYPKKKQWALENAPLLHDWILFLDADEEVSSALAREIRGIFRNPPRDTGYFVGLDYRFLGRTLQHGQRVYKLILFDRTRGRFEEHDDLDASNMWEVEGHYQPRIDGSVGTLASRLLHDDNDSLFHYFERHNRYSDWEAVLRRNSSGANGRAAHEAHVESRAKRVFGALPFKPLAFFLYSYVVRRGFLDGRAGYHYAVAKAFYYWQIRLKELELAERSP